MKNIFLIVFVFFTFIGVGHAQPIPLKGGNSVSFIDYQKSLTRPGDALRRKEDTLRKQFEEKKLEWPAKYIYIRSFKYDSQLEVWVKNDQKEKFQLFKTYKVCALAGTLGPKRMEGDYQVPEGFYNINEFNPQSNYYLSLGINYPNASDKILSDSIRPGSAIYIHGSCVTVGCIPITDQQIDELYILAAYAKDQGQDFIPVHIFPIRFDKEKSVKYLQNLAKDDAKLKKFAGRMEDAFEYFEKYKQLPIVLIDKSGEYIVCNAPGHSSYAFGTDKVKRPPHDHRIRNIAKLAESVHEWPQFPGGATAYTKYLEKFGKDMAEFLPSKIKKVYVQVEFIIDKDGVPVNFKVVKSLDDDEFNDELLFQMEKMPNWKPALLQDKPVAKKMVQTITLGE